MSIEQGVLIAGMLSTVVPVVAVLIRGRSRQMTLATALTAGSVGTLLFIILQLVNLGPRPVPTPWVYGLMASAVPLLLAGYLLAVGFGQDRPEDSLRSARPTLITLGLIGIAFLALLQSEGFVTGYDWASGRGTIHIGGLGKAFLTYLLVGIVAAGQALERTYRGSAGDLRHRLRLPMFGFFGLIIFATFILTTGLLYSSMGLGKFVALAIPVALASLTVGYGYLRGGIMDVATPVSRDIVYSSFTAFAAGLFVLSVGVAAQIATLTKWSPDEILVLAAVFLAGLVALLLLLSNRFQRAVRRFIDRNFYVNRYDYRAQWSKVTETLVDAADRDGVIERAARLLSETFLAENVTISLEDRGTGTIRSVIGPGVGSPTAVLGPSCPICVELIRGRKSLLLNRKADDFTYIPIYAENREWLDLTASQIVAPLLHGDQLVGVVGLARSHQDDPFTFEDVALLDRVAAHIASTLRSTQLAAELAETREMELMSQWSSMILHDLKNYLTPLRMVARNLIDQRSRPDIAERCARDLSLLADRMETLVQTLRPLRENPSEGMTRVQPNALVRAVISDLQAADGHAVQVELHLQSEQHVQAPEGMLRRVIENLVTNALDAMGSGGRLVLETNDCNFKRGPYVCIDVIDNGPGISEEFLRDQLFRPFSTTKQKGLGLGLYQCRSIIHALGGELTVKSQVGEGAAFRIALPMIEPTLDTRTPVKTEPVAHSSGVALGQQLFSTHD